jgi:tRNA(Arg) A34 adenosine deaminase TadA
MRLALREAARGMRRGNGGPFGAAIVRRGRLIASAHNAVLSRRDATAHAEICAIQAASRKLGRFDLSGCELYSTTEPCPMCFSAIHWARLDRVVFGTGIADVNGRGFHELTIPAARMKRLGGSRVALAPRFMLAECRALLREWDRLPRKRTY